MTHLGGGGGGGGEGASLYSRDAFPERGGKVIQIPFTYFSLDNGGVYGILRVLKTYAQDTQHLA